MSGEFFENTTEHGYDRPKPVGIDIFEEMKKPEIKEAIEGRISCLVDELVDEFPTLINQDLDLMPLVAKIRNEKIVQHIYNTVYKNAKNERFKEEYQGKPGQLARIFSYLFILKRDSQKIQGDYVQIKLKNKYATLNVRSEWDLNTVSSSIKHGVTVKDLWERKTFKGRSYRKIEFYPKEQGIKIWYIAESFTIPVKTESLKQLDGYIRSIWGESNIFNIKIDTFQKVYPFSEYRWDLDPSNATSPANKKAIQERVLRDNSEVYHKLVQEYELKKLIETNQIKLYCHELKEELKKEITDSSDIQQTVTAERLKELKKIMNSPSAKVTPKVNKTTVSKKKKSEAKVTPVKQQAQKTEKTQVIETKNTLIESVLKKIENNENIQTYLENKYSTLPQEKRLAKFKRSIWAAKDNFSDNVMAFTYLLQHSYKNWENIQLWEYYQEKTWKKWSDLWKAWENALFRKYAWEVQEIYSWKKMSNNLTIMRWLIIEHELGTKFEDVIEKEKRKPLFNFKEHWLDPTIMQWREAEFGPTWNDRCWKTVRLFFKDFWIQAPQRDSAQQYIDELEANGVQAMNRTDLAETLKSQFKTQEKTTFDVYPKTKNGHRCVCFVWTDGNIHVLDNHNYEITSYPLAQYLDKHYPNLEFVLGEGHPITPEDIAKQQAMQA